MKHLKYHKRILKKEQQFDIEKIVSASRRFQVHNKYI